MMTSSIMEQKIEEGSSIKLDDTEITGKTILSNTILAFGGGEDLQLSTSNDKEINIYAFDKVDLPSYWKLDGDATILTKFERGTDGYISIPWKDWARKETKDYDKDGNLIDGRIFKINAINNLISSILVPITLTGDNTEATIKVLDSSNIPMNGDIYVYALNSKNPIKYIELPPNSNGISIEFKYSKDVFDQNIVKDINDVLRIGYPRLIPSEDEDSKISEYSDQVIKTLNYIDPNPTDESKFTVDSLLKYIINNYPEFDLTYIVNDEDAIDGEATIKDNWNNLFTGDLIWDKNHICNRYTIPQWDFKNSSIKVAPVYIKK